MRCLESAFLVWRLVRSMLVLGISGLRTLYGGSKKVVELRDVTAFSFPEMAESTSLVDVFGGMRVCLCIAESGGLYQDLV